MGKKYKMEGDEGPRGGQFGGGGPEIPGNFEQPPHPFEQNPPGPAQHDDQEFSHWEIGSESGVPHYRYVEDNGTVHDVWYQPAAGDGWRAYDEWTRPDGSVATYFSDPPYGEWNAGQLHGADTYTKIDPNDPNPPDFLFRIPPDLPPGVSLDDPYSGYRQDYGWLNNRDAETFTDQDGNLVHRATDRDGRVWDWFREADGSYSLGYTDKASNWHEVSEQDGIWHDRWTDQNGGEWHSTQDAQGNTLSTTTPYGDIQERPPDDFKDNVFADPPPPYQGAPPDDFKDKAVEPPPYQERPPDDFKDKVFAADQAPSPGNFILDYGPGALANAQGGEVQEAPPVAGQHPEAEPPVPPPPPGSRRHRRSAPALFQRQRPHR